MSVEQPSTRRLVVLSAIAGLCALVAGLSIRLAILRSHPETKPAIVVTASTETVHHAAPALLPPVQPLNPTRPVVKRTHFLFRSTRTDPHYGQMALAALPGGAQVEPQYFPELPCLRLAYQNGFGVCIAANMSSGTSYDAIFFDRSFKPLRSVSLTGAPSRAQVSPDGTLAAVTVFALGHSYADSSMSTKTTLIETATGTTLADLETFAVTRDGQPFKAADFNFWGVTFTRDSAHFYATLSSGGKIYLIFGDVAGRTAKVIATDIECPSLSPDNTRLAYKKRIVKALRVNWRLSVFDLKTMKRTELAEPRPIDDQVEWFDNDHVLYALPTTQMTSSPSTDSWVVPADGHGKPRKLLASAYSPVAF